MRVGADENGNWFSGRAKNLSAVARAPSCRANRANRHGSHQPDADGSEQQDNEKVARRFFITRRNAAPHGTNRRMLGAGWSFELGKAILDQMSLFVLMFIERP
jgi:hypothetical protein